MRDLQHRVAVITGAASGIGRALAQACAARGARVVLADVDAAGLEVLRGEIEARGAEALAVPTDVSRREQVDALRDATLARFGQADLLFNNAGVAVSQTIEQMAYDDLEWLLGVNLWGVIHGTKAFLPLLRARPEAAIVNLSSVFGLVALPTQGAYNTSKFAVRGFTEALAHELAGSSVHVMCVLPGGVSTAIARNARFHVAPDGNRDHRVSIDRFARVARTTPAKAAATILRGLELRRSRCLVGADAKVIELLQRLMPVSYWSVLRRMLR
jgi:NAD(P)-dependent dehydrogenase (short-subunit alcohol dehydrogenase family)